MNSEKISTPNSLLATSSIATCTQCERKAIYKNQGTSYCKDHFLDYFETKVLKTIKKFELFQKNDRVCVAVSGGKDSMAVLFMTMKYCKHYGIDFFALLVDEGIKGYRDKTIVDMKAFCEKYEVNLNVVSFKEKLGATLDSIRDAGIKEKKKPCTVCGIFRRTLLNRGARELNATKLVTGHNLDDEAQTFMMNVFQGNMSANAKLGPVTGVIKNSKFITRVKPLYFMTEKESRLYCLMKGFDLEFTECPNINLSFRMQVRDKLNEITAILPNAKYGIVNSFLELLPDLKEKYSKDASINYCSICAEPTSGEICNACKMEESLISEFKVSKA